MKRGLLPTSRTVIVGLAFLGAIHLAAAHASEPTASQTILQKLQNRAGITVKRGQVPVFHSARVSQKDILFTQSLMTRAVRFFGNNPAIGQKLDVYAAILSKQDWEGIPIREEIAPGVIIDVPYGLPGLTDQGPWGAMLGTTQPSDVDRDGNDDNVLTAANLEVVAKMNKVQRQALRRAGFANENEAARQMPLLAAIHEMGHVYARRLGIAFENHQSRVLDETLANFFLYAFLRSQPDLKKYVTLWNTLLDAYVSTQCPQHRSMEIFDEVYFGVADPEAGGSMLNFLYFQGMAQARAREIHDTRGLGFLKDLKRIVAAMPSGSSVKDFYAELKKYDAGFQRWYDSFESSSGCR